MDRPEVIPLTPDDDKFHLYGDHPYETETFWASFRRRRRLGQLALQPGPLQPGHQQRWCGSGTAHRRRRSTRSTSTGCRWSTRTRTTRRPPPRTATASRCSSRFRSIGCGAVAPGGRPEQHQPVPPNRGRPFAGRASISRCTRRNRSSCTARSSTSTLILRTRPLPGPASRPRAPERAPEQATCRPRPVQAPSSGSATCSPPRTPTSRSSPTRCRASTTGRAHKHHGPATSCTRRPLRPAPRRQPPLRVRPGKK